MPCSSSSSEDNDDDPDYRVDSSNDEADYRAVTPDDDGNGAAAVVLPLAADPEGVASFLLTQDDVDAVCEKYGVPMGRYTARSAGDLRASSPPPAGAVCVYAHALEAGMRVPLHPFFRDVLAHFGVAPTQLTPNSWRIMAAFLVLCHSTGVPPSPAVFRHFYGFFPLPPVNSKQKGWYFFRSRDTSGLCFEGLPHRNKDWKHGFFFLSSTTEPWTCPVEWGEPSESSVMEPVLSGEEEEMAEKLVQAHDAAPVDLKTYLCDSNLAAAMISPASPVPATPPSCARTSGGPKVMDPIIYAAMKTMRAEKAASPVPATPPSCARTSAGPKVMDPIIYGVMKTIRAEKAAASSAKTVKTEPGPSPLRGKKRSLDEANGASPAADGWSVPAGERSPPPGFSRTPRQFACGHDGGRGDSGTAQELLLQERVLSANRPSDVHRVVLLRRDSPGTPANEMSHSHIPSVAG
jgi:hypothetical protein